MVEQNGKSLAADYDILSLGCDFCFSQGQHRQISNRAQRYALPKTIHFKSWQGFESMNNFPLIFPNFNLIKGQYLK